EQVDTRYIGPEPVTETAADERKAGFRRRRCERRGHHARGLGGRGDTREVNATQGEGVLREVDMVIPQPGQQPATLEVDRVARSWRTSGADRGDAATFEAHVDEAVVKAGVCESGHGGLSGAGSRQARPEKLSCSTGEI